MLASAWPYLRRALVAGLILGLVCTLATGLLPGVVPGPAYARGRTPIARYVCRSQGGGVDVTVFEGAGLRVIDGYAAFDETQGASPAVDPLTGEVFSPTGTPPPLLAVPEGAREGWYIPDCTTELLPWKAVLEGRVGRTNGAFRCYAAGYPFRCFQGMETTGTDGRRVHGLWDVRPASEHVVCLFPRWGALAVDVFAWWFAWALVLGASPAVRVIVRHRAGACPRCAYDLRGRFREGCPECGWNKPGSGVG
ncbi:MAG: hypothetical protein U0637_05570 [Phycisphaerales bacterium]